MAMIAFALAVAASALAVAASPSLTFFSSSAWAAFSASVMVSSVLFVYEPENACAHGLAVYRVGVTRHDAYLESVAASRHGVIVPVLVAGALGVGHVEV